jgi:hypothetical protein
MPTSVALRAISDSLLASTPTLEYEWFLVFPDNIISAPPKVPPRPRIEPVPSGSFSNLLCYSWNHELAFRDALPLPTQLAW